MNKITMPGTFKGKVIEHGVSLTSNDNPQVVMDVALEQVWDETNGEWMDYSDSQEHVIAYLVLFNADGKKMLNTDQVMKVFGWDGSSFAELDSMDLSDILFQIRVEENDYEGATSPYTVNWIDEEDAVPGQRVKKLDESELKSLDKKFNVLLKKAGKTSAPKSKPGAPKTQKPASAKGGKSSKPAADKPKPPRS
jgi:hypothetical protein